MCIGSGEQRGLGLMVRQLVFVLLQSEISYGILSD
jgi:hypothetical protein